MLRSSEASRSSVGRGMLRFEDCVQHEFVKKMFRSMNHAQSTMWGNHTGRESEHLHACGIHHDQSCTCASWREGYQLAMLGEQQKNRGQVFLCNCGNCTKVEGAFNSSVTDEFDSVD